MSDYTPTTEQVREAYATRNAPAQDLERRAAFDRWLADHDRDLQRKWVQAATEDVIAHDEALEKALREQIAQDIDKAYLGPDFDRNPATGADSPHAAEHQAFDEGLEVAARIARGERP